MQAIMLASTFLGSISAASSRGVNYKYIRITDITTFTCDQYAHNVVMDTFKNANNFKN